MTNLIILLLFFTTLFQLLAKYGISAAIMLFAVSTANPFAILASAFVAGAWIYLFNKYIDKDDN